jgi:hypothetical protein
MNTEASTPTVPANPAKGNLQGQTTLAAKIDRWTGFSNNLAPQIDQLPQLQDQFTQFQAMLVQARAVRDRIMVIKGDAEDAVKQRDSLVAQGDDLFTRLGFALKAIHGPQSSLLRAYGLKPRKTGRPRKAAVPVPPPPTVEVHTVAPAPTAGGASAAQGVTGASGTPESVK